MDEPESQIEKARSQLVEAYLEAIRRKYDDMDRHQKVILMNSLETMVSALDRGLHLTINERNYNCLWNGKKAREIRLGKGLSLGQLGKMLGDVAKATLSNWERGISTPSPGRNDKGDKYLKWLVSQEYDPFALDTKK